ncbi:nuclear transport factor 2 family protein [Aquimarina hainanensis]|uniref:Nuclear transport factor 2 family protein n=2 Tax=Aquimarina hainanensis TaxID=1578017 RepID=A0ABW5N9P8_9FLAO
MQKLQSLLIILFIILNACSKKKPSMEEEKIKLLINECYLNGALNTMKTQEMRRGYHKDFAIFYKEGTSLQKLPLENWITMVETYKNGPDHNNGLRSFKGEIAQIDITQDAAFVKLKLYRNNTLIFTDYITLLKFEKQWQIVTKIYHSHIKNPWVL